MVRVERSFPAPESLAAEAEKADGSYSKSDVVERLKKMNVLYEKLEEYKKKPESKVLNRTLKALLKRETAFAGFKRCYVRGHLKEYPLLAEYIA